MSEAGRDSREVKPLQSSVERGGQRFELGNSMRDRLALVTQFDRALPELSQPPSLTLSLPDEVGRDDITHDLGRIATVIKKDQFKPPESDAPNGSLELNDGSMYRIIGRDTRIDKGIDLAYGLEYGIVVDFSRDKALQAVFKNVVTTLPDDLGDESVLRHIMTWTQRVLPYNAQIVSDFRSEQKMDPGKDESAQLLGDYIFMKQEEGRVVGAGICQHQSLFAAAVTERLIDGGVLDGRTGVMRNHVFRDGSVHNWQVYQGGGRREAWVSDPARGILKPISQLTSADWEYGLKAETDLAA